MDYSEFIKFYPDFPIKGVNFVDILPFIQDKALLQNLIDDVARLCGTANLAAPEARGFLFAPAIQYAPHSPVQTIIPLRKKGKLPSLEGDLVQVEIMKEYGPDHLFYRRSDLAACIPAGDIIEVTFFDDILATGGTSSSMARSLNEQKITIGDKVYDVKVKDFVFLVEIDGLPGRSRVEQLAPVKSVLHVTKDGPAKIRK